MTMKLRGTVGLKVLLFQLQRYRGRSTVSYTATPPSALTRAVWCTFVMHEVKLNISAGEHLVDLGFSSFTPAGYTNAMRYRPLSWRELRQGTMS
jgi:hypothetical protein